jgi:hypothetical protein
MSLETGYYALESVTFISPDEPAVSRPLGEGENSQVVVLPQGAPPKKVSTLRSIIMN